MPELKLGTKFECYSCGTKFYDLGKNDPLCPKCGANQKDVTSSDVPAAGQSSRRRRKTEVAAKAIDVDDDEPIADLDEEIVPDAEIEGEALDDDDDDEDFDDEE